MSSLDVSFHSKLRTSPNPNAGIGARSSSRNSDARGFSPIDVIASTAICSILFVFFAASSSEFTHWFVIPIFVCGVLTGTDAVRWFRSSYSVMDPFGLLGILGFHFFFLAPLLHVYWDFWVPFIQGLPDWRNWLGLMAALNAVGLIFSIFGRNIKTSTSRQTVSAVWNLDESRFALLLTISLAITGMLQLMVYARFGGIAGYIGASSDESLSGWGWVFMLSESFPILFVFGFILFARRHPAVACKGVTILLMLVVFIFLKFMFGGLRGSRGNIVWGLFWFVWLINHYVRSITRKQILMGVAALSVFMYGYGFYKSYRLDAIDAFTNPQIRQEMSQSSGRSVHGLLLSDFGRSDVQALTFHNIVMDDRYLGYKLAMGRTYAGAIALLVPDAIWSDHPITKSNAGTRALYGQIAFDSIELPTSRAFGIAGEAMLNFGPIAVPIAYFVFGLALGGVRRFVFALSPSDSRNLIVPLLITMCIYLLIWDSDNFIFFLVKTGALPFAVILLASRREVVTRSAEVQRL